MAKDFFTLEELATRYRCNQITVRRWFARGAFPMPIQINAGKLLWPASVIEAFERRFQAQAAAPAKTEVAREPA